MSCTDIDRQVAEIFKPSYKRYLIGEIGDVDLLTRIDLLTWALALSELAADFKAIADAVETKIVVAH